MKIALVHDWLLRLGGAERVLKTLHEMFPTAPIHTLFFNKPFVRRHFPDADIRSSLLQKYYPALPHKLFAPLAPMAIESFNFRGFDTVISSSIAFAKGILPKSHTRHICYCYSPTRWLWDWTHNYTDTGTVSRITRHMLRLWDYPASKRVDTYVAISRHVRDRIRKYYGRSAEILHPPLAENQSLETPKELSSFYAIKHRFRKGYFLIVSQLHPHKNVALAGEAFAKLKLPLVVVGDGPERSALQARFRNEPNILFTGFAEDALLPYWYRHASAFVMPQEEDFGLTAVEAMRYGTPVLALRKGGALDTVAEGLTGEFFDAPHSAVLADGVRRIRNNIARSVYSPRVIQKWSNRFSKDKFIYGFKKIIYDNPAA